MKKLSEMSLEELWQLFPIFLTEHQDCWETWYAEEAALIRRHVPRMERLSHIGSTAVPSIWAKPIIDILLEVPKEIGLNAPEEQLTACGYRCMSRSDGRISLNKGYTEQGFAQKVFHLHVRYTGDHDELYFRDWLIEHRDAARQYETEKLALWKKYTHDRDAYTNAKSAFVQRCTRQAKEAYPGRYENDACKHNER